MKSDEWLQLTGPCIVGIMLPIYMVFMITIGVIFTLEDLIAGKINQNWFNFC